METNTTATDHEDTNKKLAETTLASINAASSVGRALYTAFMALTAYIIVALGTTDDLQFFDRAPLTLPLLNVEISLTGFYRYTPWLYVIMHANLLLVFSMIAEKHRYFAELVDNCAWPDRVHMRQQLHVSAFIQFLGADHKGLLALILKLMIWLTVGLIPPLLLLSIQLDFLAAQIESVTNWQQSAVLVDNFLAGFFWNNILQKARRARFPKDWSPPLWKRYLLEGWVLWLCVVLIVGFSWLVALVPLTDYERKVHNSMPEWGWLGLANSDCVLDKDLERLRIQITAKEKSRSDLRELKEKLEKQKTIFNNQLVNAAKDAREWKEEPYYCSNRLTWWFIDRPNSWLNERLDIHRWLNLPDKVFVKNRNAVQPQWLNRLKNELNDNTANAKVNKPVLNENNSKTTNVEVSISFKTLDYFLPVNKEHQHFYFARFSRSFFPNAQMMKIKLQGTDLSDAKLQGAKLMNANLQGAKLIRANLQNADLNAAKLQGAKLNNANLQGAKLNNANLQGTELIKANLQIADLNNANLQEAKLNNANLQGANLNFANLQEAKLNNAKLQGANLRATKLKSANLTGAHLENADLGNSNLQGADLRSADLQGANLSRAYLYFANLSNANLQEAEFILTNLNVVDLRYAKLQSSKYLSGANLLGGNLSNAYLQGVNLSGASLQGVNFDDAYLEGVNLSDAKLQGAILTNANLQGSILLSSSLAGAQFSNAKLDYALILQPDIIEWKARSSQQVSIINMEFFANEVPEKLIPKLKTMGLEMEGTAKEKLLKSIERLENSINNPRLTLSEATLKQKEHRCLLLADDKSIQNSAQHICDNVIDPDIDPLTYLRNWAKYNVLISCKYKLFSRYNRPKDSLKSYDIIKQYRVSASNDKGVSEALLDLAFFLYYKELFIIHQDKTRTCEARTELDAWYKKEGYDDHPEARDRIFNLKLEPFPTSP